MISPFLFRRKFTTILVGFFLLWFFSGTVFIFAQSGSEFECVAFDTTGDTGFTGPPSPTGATDGSQPSASLIQNQTFALTCSLLDGRFPDSDEVTANIITPDLTASTPTVTSSGGGSGKTVNGARELYSGMLKITGQVVNKTTATSEVPNATFLNEAQYSTDNTTWSALFPDVLLDDTTGTITSGASRAIGNTASNKMEWPSGLGTFYFRLCANRPISTSFIESDSTVASNCSAPDKVTIIDPPTNTRLTVASARNGVGTSGVVVVSSNGFGGTTEYTQLRSGTISTTLTAPVSDGANGTFVSWTPRDTATGCTTGTAGGSDAARTCTLAVPTDGGKTVTANYARPDLISNSLLVQGLTAVTGGYRLGSFTLTAKANNASTLVSAPGTFVNSYYLRAGTTGTWTKIGVPKPLVNTATLNPGEAGRVIATSDSGSISTAGSYYFRVCADDPGSVSEAHELNNCTDSAPYTFVGEPDLTANAPTVSGLSTGEVNTFWAEGDITISGSINNDGLAATPDGLFKSRYQYSVTKPSVLKPADNDASFSELALASLQSTATAVGAGEKNRSIQSLLRPKGSFAGTPTGSKYYLRVCADAASGVSESTENNNCSPYTEITIKNRPAIDLTVDILPTGNDDQPDQVNAPYASNHTLYWKSASVTSCATTFDASTATNNTTGVARNGLFNPTYTYGITCNAVGGGTVSDTVIVDIDPPSLSCAPAPTSPKVGETVTWSATAIPATPPSGSYAYSWSGDDVPGDKKLTGTGKTAAVAYTAPGQKSATVSLTVPGSPLRTISSTCSLSASGVSGAPDLTANTPVISGSDTGEANTFWVEGDLTISGSVNNQGTASTLDGSFRSSYVYSSAPNGPFLTLDDVPLFSATRVLPGERDRSIESVTFRHPVGTYYFKVCADQPPLPNGAVSEANGSGTGESNNCSDAIAVTLKRRPVPSIDLTVDVLPTGRDDQADNITAPYASDHVLYWKGTDVKSCQTSFHTGSETSNLTGVPRPDLFNPFYTYYIDCDTVPDSPIPTVSDVVTVTIDPPTLSCDYSPKSPQPKIGDLVTWTAAVSSATPPSGSYSYAWRGDDVPGDGALSGTGKTTSITYTYPGPKSATISVTVPGSPLRTISSTCSISADGVKGIPDLIGNTPSVTSSGGSSGKTRADGSRELYSGLLKLTGSVRNMGNGDTPNATFVNRVLFSTDGTSWFDFYTNEPLDTVTGVVAAGETRTIGNAANNRMEWTSSPGGPFWFRLCADQPPLPNGAVVESNTSGTGESNNCSSPTKVVIIDPPQNTRLTVKSTRDGVSSNGVFVSSSARGFIGTTEYTIFRNGEIASTTLTAPLSDPLGAKFISWTPRGYATGCGGGTDAARTCIISIPADAGKTVTANYETLPDITLEVKPYQSTENWSTSASIPYNYGVEIRWSGSRCGGYAARSAIGTAVSNPALSSWTGQKTIQNGSLSIATLSNLTSASYTLTLTCSNNAGNISKNVVITVGAPSFSCTGSPVSPAVGSPVSWKASPATYSGYSWSGTDGLVGSGSSITRTYSSLGTKSATVSATASGGQTVTASCQVSTVAPDLSANIPTASGNKNNTYFVAGSAITLGGTVDNTGSAATLNGTFTNRILYSLDRVNWSQFATVPLKDGSRGVNTDENTASGKSRAVVDFTWGSGGEISPGTYYFKLCADQPPLPNGAVVESNTSGTGESNNCSGLLQVDVEKYPDLIVSKNPAPVATGTLIHGDPHTFTGEVKNIGLGAVSPASTFGNRYQILLSQAIGGSIIALANNSIISGLGVGEAKPVTSGSWTARAGKHRVVLCADEPTNAIFESNELNNCSPSEVTAGASTISVYPRQPVVFPSTPSTPEDCGGKVFLAYSGGQGGILFRLSRAVGSDSNPYVVVEEATTLSGLRTIDNGLTPSATYFYKVEAVGPDNLAVVSLPKSAASSPSCTTPLPDLVAIAVNVKGTLTAGSSLYFTGTVKNAGNVDIAANQSFLNKFTLTPPAGSSLPNTLIVGLSKGAEKTANSGTWIAEEGTYTITFCTDTGNNGSGTITEIDESRESNCKNTSFIVTGDTTGATLSATLTADKSGEVAPLRNVSLISFVSGTATGAVGYTFDYTSDGVAEVSKTVPEPATGDTSYTTTGTERYTFTTAGKYVSRVDVTRGGKRAEATTPIYVRPPLTLSMGTSCQSIGLSWGTTNGAVAYMIYRSTDGGAGTFEMVKSVTVPQTSYTDTGIDPNTTYYYQIEALLTDRTSLYSDVKGQLSSGPCVFTNTLTVSVQGTGAGMVSSEPEGIACSEGSCSAVYPRNTLIRLTAEYSASATKFDGWTNCPAISGNGDICTLTLSADRTVTATFTAKGGRKTNPENEVPAGYCYSQVSGLNVTWFAQPRDGDGDGDIDGTASYHIRWTGGPEIVTTCNRTNSCTQITDERSVSQAVSYTTAGTKSGAIEITDSGGSGQKTSASCTANTVAPDTPDPSPSTSPTPGDGDPDDPVKVRPTPPKPIFEEF